MKSFLNLLILLISIFLNSQIPVIEWPKTYGGSEDDFPNYSNTMVFTDDGKIVFAGITYSDDGDVNNNHGNGDYWIVKINQAGNIEWEKAYGGSERDRPYCIKNTNDGGFIVVGITSSNDGDISNPNPGQKAWIVKLDMNGNIQWEKSYKGQGLSILPREDGYIVTGIKANEDPDDGDYWIFKLDLDGELIWEKLYNKGYLDYALVCIPANDGGYIVSGEARYYDIAWTIKVDESGELEWEKEFGGSGVDYFANAISIANGYVFIGTSSSNDGDVTGNHGLEDIWVVKTNNSGDIIWQKCLGGSGEDYGSSIIGYPDGSFLVIGSTGSNDGDITHNIGGFDSWLVKLDSSGNIMWQKTFGGTLNDDGISGIINDLNELFVIGDSESNDGDVGTNKGGSDIWVLKFNSNLSTIENEMNDLLIYPNPVSNNILNLKSTEKIQEVNIFNSTGELIKNMKLNSLETNVNVDFLSSGIYYFQFILSNNKVKSQKIIIL